MFSWDIHIPTSLHDTNASHLQPSKLNSELNLHSYLKDKWEPCVEGRTVREGESNLGGGVDGKVAEGFILLCLPCIA